MLILVALTAAAVIAFMTGVPERASRLMAPDDGQEPAGASGEASTAVVLVTGGDGRGAEVYGITVLAYDGARQEGSILLVPPSTIADIPGYGTFPLREAYAAGGGPLVDVSLANLLGLRFDAVATISPQGWAELLAPTDGYEIDVRREVEGRTPDGAATRFVPGPQQLDGPALADYLTMQVEGESELDALPRAQRVLLGLLDRLGQEPDQLDRLLADGATPVETEDLDALRRVLDQLTVARADGEVTVLSLPVRALGSDDDDGFRLDVDRAEALAEGPLSAWAPDGDVTDGRRVQILNGNGIPRIGQHVAGKLSGGGYQVVLSGNADRFTYQETRIILHTVDEPQLEVAQDVQERLGTGVIERSATPQSVVDITIVVGADITPDG